MKSLCFVLAITFMLFSLSACQREATPPLALVTTPAATATPTTVPSSATPLATPALTPVPLGFPVPPVQPSQACLVAELPLLANGSFQPKAFAWSPTDAVLAYIAPGEAPQGVLMLVAASDFESPQRLAAPANSELIWSPDGTQLAFVTQRAADALGTVMLVNRDGTELRDLFPGAAAQTDPGAGFKALAGWWDAEHLLVARNCGSGARCLLLLDLVQQTQTDVYPDGPAGIYQYAWSPDRSAFVATAGFNPQIGLFAPQPGTLLQHSGLDELRWRSGVRAMDEAWADFWTFFAAWDPDSRHVLFLRQPAAGATPPELWVWDIASTDAAFLLPGVIAAQWSPDGERIAFLTWGTSLVAPDGSWAGVAPPSPGPQPLGVGLYHWPTGEIISYFEVGTLDLAVSQAGEMLPASLALAWSPDSSQVLYADGAGRAWILAGDGSMHYELPASGEPTDRVARWSSAGRWLVLAGTTALHLYAVPCAP